MAAEPSLYLHRGVCHGFRHVLIRVSPRLARMRVRMLLGDVPADVLWGSPHLIHGHLVLQILERVLQVQQ